MTESTITAAELVAAGRAALIAGDTVTARLRFREALEIDPHSVDALLGMATALRPYRDKREYLLRALAVDPENSEARATLEQVEARLAAGELLAPTGVQVREREEAAVEEPPAAPVTPASETLVCYRHPQRETGLRCISCGRPICTECARATPVGQICPECARERTPVNYQVGPTQLLVAGVVALIYALLVTLVAGVVIGWAGFFGFIVAFLLGPMTGNALSRLIDWATGRKRGRMLMIVVSVAYACGSLPYIGFIILLGGFPLALLFFSIIVVTTALAWLR
ncbi:B-box zinc finger protein [Chloroflexus aggregans]|uniref:TPR repeat-containing protein n=1 Tax=Chloroflexus aggregans (strain MD-66 / DSM 9485) TaxID=326427 RepID=B8G6E5_CHLAD|nr:B-box zinc finger protein [Chloroflexus aggregans]ACL23882.1 TPR repeat-containing protein [Chloroflexus aggregans DSM 9485]